VTTDGRFVPGSAPGDIIEPDGTIIRGPHHIDPPCQHFSRCGGCELQHVDDIALADFVRSRVVNAAEGQGITPEEILPTHLSPTRSRRRAVSARPRTRLRQARPTQIPESMRAPARPRRRSERQPLGSSRSASRSPAASGRWPCPTPQRPPPRGSAERTLGQQQRQIAGFVTQRAFRSAVFASRLPTPTRAWRLRARCTLRQTAAAAVRVARARSPRQAALHERAPYQRAPVPLGAAARAAAGRVSHRRA